MELFNGQVSKGYVAEEYALWGHGNTQQINEYRGEETPQMLLCADCDDKCDPAVMSEEEKVSKAEVALDKNAHCEVWDRWFYCPDCQTGFDDPIEHRQTVHAVTSGAPYLDHVPWDIREINTNASGAELTEPVTTDPEMTRERRIRDYVGQTLTSPTHTCEFTPTNQPGVEHCNECGTYKLQPGESFTDMIADASDGASIEELMKIEPGVLSTVIPNDKIIETNVITSADELETVTTTDEIATLLIERVNSLTKYLDTEPSFDRLVRESGLDVFLDEFDLDEEIRRAPDQNIAVNRTHICPYGNVCPKKIKTILDNKKLCGLCPASLSFKSDGPAIAAEIRRLGDEIADLSVAIDSGELTDGEKASYSQRRMSLTTELSAWMCRHDYLIEMSDGEILLDEDGQGHYERKLTYQIPNETWTDDQETLWRILETSEVKTLQSERLRAKARRGGRTLVTRITPDIMDAIESDPVKAAALTVKKYARLQGLSLDEVVEHLETVSEETSVTPLLQSLTGNTTDV
jgi:hypothetical protein